MKIFNTVLNFLSAAPDLTFEPQRFVDMLGYMGKGMLVIFVLIGVIVLVTMFINKIFSDKNKY